MRIFGEADTIDEYLPDVSILKQLPYINEIYGAQGSKQVIIVIPSDFITHQTMALIINNMIKNEDAHKINYSVKLILKRSEWKKQFDESEEDWKTRMESIISEEYGHLGAVDIEQDIFKFQMLYKGNGSLASESYLLDLRHEILIKSLKIQMKIERSDSFMNMLGDINNILRERGVNIAV